MDSLKIAMVFLALVSIAGCQQAQQRPVVDKSTKLLEENISLKTQVQTLQKQNTQLNQQITTLQGLPADKRLDKVINIKKLDILPRSSFFDKDKDKKKESLFVYFRLLDETGDAIKAPGQASIELWDLNKTSGKNLLKKWDFTNEELKKLWVSSMISQNYRIMLNVKGLAITEKSDLVLRIVFTDYISGKVFSEKQSIKNPSGV